MNKTPKVSIIMPTYNRADLLPRAITSILMQTFEDFELIVVDDASIDQAAEVVGSFDDMRIRYLRHETNIGGAAARNTGIEAAHGEYIAFQDSDDEWLPEKLEKQMGLVRQDNNIRVVYSGLQRIGCEKIEYIPSRHVRLRQGEILEQLLDFNLVSTQTLLVKKECFEKVGNFDPTLPRFQDWDLAIRLARQYPFRLIDEPLVKVYTTEGSITSGKLKGAKALEQILDKYSELFTRKPRFLSKHLCSIGRLNCLFGSIRVGQKWFWKAVKTCPMSMKAWIGWILSLMGKRAYRIGSLLLGKNVKD